MGNVSSWPKETIAQGSSVHPPNIFEDRLRIHNDSLAIDGNQSTFWKECVFLGNLSFLRTTLTKLYSLTAGSWPDSLTVTTPSTISLNGIVVLSHYQSWLLDYTVDTPDPNNQWASPRLRIGIPVR